MICCGCCLDPDHVSWSRNWLSRGKKPRKPRNEPKTFIQAAGDVLLYVTDVRHLRTSGELAGVGRRSSAFVATLTMSAGRADHQTRERAGSVIRWTQPLARQATRRRTLSLPAGGRKPDERLDSTEGPTPAQSPDQSRGFSPDRPASRRCSAASDRDERPICAA
jgi:hypothetical protein